MKELDILKQELDPEGRLYLHKTIKNMSFLLRHLVNRIQPVSGCTDFDQGKYTYDELNTMITVDGYIPVASASELAALNFVGSQTMGVGTCWEDSYTTSADNNGKKFVQVRNIDFVAASSWTTAIELDNAYYDGAELLIDNLSGTRPLFTGSTSPSLQYLSNITMSNVAISDAGATITALTRQIAGGSVVNCQVGGTVTGGNGSSGIVGGSNTLTADLDITNCTFDGTVSGGRYASGIIGNAIGSASFSVNILGCTVIGDISGNDWVGGVCGNSIYTNIDQTSVLADVAATTSVIAGGIVGRTQTSTVITDCYVQGDISSATGRSGGIVGQSAPSDITITNTYAACTMSGSTTSRGGIIGLENSGGNDTVTDSYWDTTIGPATTAGGGTGKTTSELQTPTTATGIYVNWSGAIWDFGTTSEYPSLI